MCSDASLSLSIYDTVWKYVYEVPSQSGLADDFVPLLEVPVVSKVPVEALGRLVVKTPHIR